MGCSPWPHGLPFTGTSQAWPTPMQLCLAVSAPSSDWSCECASDPRNLLWSGEKLRCMGSGLSPNGLPFSQEGVVSLALLDNIKYLDLQKGRITVEAGARIQPVSPLAHRSPGVVILRYSAMLHTASMWTSLSLCHFLVQCRGSWVFAECASL